MGRKPPRAKVVLPPDWRADAGWALIAGAVVVVASAVLGLWQWNRWTVRRRRDETARLRLQHFEQRSRQSPVRSRTTVAAARGEAEQHRVQTAGETGARSSAHWDPPRYQPDAAALQSRALAVREMVEVRDGGYEWRAANALLDTGNLALTVVDSDFARASGLYLAEAPSVFAQAEEWTVLRGVVPGAEARAPVITINLRVHGLDFAVRAAVSPLHDTQVLVGLDVLHNLFSAGFSIAHPDAR